MKSKVQGMATENGIPRQVAMIVPVLIGFLLLGALIFFKERMLFIDAPHILFRIINDGQLRIEENRYGSFITQMFPLIGSRLHLPLGAILVLYSASFYLFYLTVALLLVFKYRNYGLAVLYGLYLTLFVSDTFYWPNNEVHQGMAWLMLAFAINAHMAARERHYLVAVPVFIMSFYLAIWTHPLIMIIAVFLWSFSWLGNVNWPYSRLQAVVFTSVILLLSYFKYKQGEHHGYDSTKIETVSMFKLEQFKSLLSSPQLHFFWKGCLTNYWLFLLLFLAGIVGAIKEKRYLQLGLTMLFAVGYLGLLCIAFRDLTANRFYIESEYMPLAVICCALFVWYLLPKLDVITSMTLVCLVFAIRLVFIFSASEAFTNRVNVLERIADKMTAKQLSKIIITEPVPGVDSTLIMNWGAPVESIIISKLKGERPQRTFLFADPGMAQVMIGIGSDTLLGCWERRGPGQVNNDYFQPDRTVQYRIISYEELMK